MLSKLIVVPDDLFVVESGSKQLLGRKRLPTPVSTKHYRRFDYTFFYYKNYLPPVGKIDHAKSIHLLHRNQSPNSFCCLFKKYTTIKRDH